MLRVLWIAFGLAFYPFSAAAQSGADEAAAAMTKFFVRTCLAHGFTHEALLDWIGTQSFAVLPGGAGGAAYLGPQNMIVLAQNDGACVVAMQAADAVRIGRMMNEYFAGAGWQVARIAGQVALGNKAADAAEFVSDGTHDWLVAAHAHELGEGADEVTLVAVAR
jgi:hypothetical protein